MTNSRVDSDILKEGDVAYFVKLHLDQLDLTGPHPSKQDHWLYSVEGKKRPMLVVRLLPGTERDRRWLLVLPITSQGLDTRGNRNASLQPIGNCLDSARNSFVELNVCKLPENMICRKNDGQLHRLTPCDPTSFANAVKVLTHKLMKSRD